MSVTPSIREKRRNPLGGILTVIFSSAIGCCYFGEPITNALSQDTLSGAEIHELFANKTVEGYHSKRGYTFKSYYEADGRFRSYQGGSSSPRDASWTVRGDEICVTWHDTREGPLCRNIIKNSDGQYRKVLKKGTKRINIVEFHSFTPGNPENL